MARCMHGATTGLGNLGWDTDARELESRGRATLAEPNVDGFDDFFLQVVILNQCLSGYTRPRVQIRKIIDFEGQIVKQKWHFD